MMMTVTFTIPGSPQSKQRPRFSRKNGSVAVYTPEETANYESLVQFAYLQQCGKAFLNGAICAEISTYFPVTQSASKKKKHAMVADEIKYIKKPDLDNVVKALLDALNGVAYHDDAQVCEMHVRKKYAEAPRVVVVLTEID